jgi:hypothetical protein
MHTMRAEQEDTACSIAHHGRSTITIQPDCDRLVSADCIVRGAARGGFVGQSRRGTELEPIGQSGQRKDGDERSEKLE